MKVSKSWLKELVGVKDINEVIRLLPLRTIAIKSVTDNYIELDMKGYNRADLLSMRGVAFEVAAITDSQVTFQDKTFINRDAPEISVNVEDNKLCSFYSLTKIENLEVEQSTDAWVQKLSDCGMRSINNIADLTNLIMLEFGQPFHAFDADKVKGTVSVRLAKKGEKLLTLDRKSRDLDPEDLVIADESGPIGLAGVMGGKETEVSDSTKTILLEAAIFNPVSIRKTVQRHNLPSEASKRFLHGLSKTRLLQALDRAINTYKELGGEVVRFKTVGDMEDKITSIHLTQEKINSLIGVDIEAPKIEEYLGKLGFELEKEDAGWEVTVPYFRLDVEIEVDLVEEIARMYGYEKIPAKELSGEKPEKIDQSLPNSIYDLKKKLSDIGLTEVQTYSFYTTAVLEALGFTDQYKKFLVKVANPMSTETEYLRMNVWPNLVEALSRNLRNGYSDIAIFEIGKSYHRSYDVKVPSEASGSYHKSYDGKEIPEEGYVLSIALMNGSDNPLSELVAIVDKLDLKVKSDHSASPEPVKNLFHPNRFVHFMKDGKEIGGMAEVHLKVLDKLGIQKRVAILEINLPL